MMKLHLAIARSKADVRATRDAGSNASPMRHYMYFSVDLEAGKTVAQAVANYQGKEIMLSNEDDDSRCVGYFQPQS